LTKPATKLYTSMRLKVITVATHEPTGLQQLRKSMDRMGLDYVVLGIGEPWQGFGMKVIKTREYLRTLEGYTHFIFVDAYDTLFLKPITEYEGGIVFSTEKNCWPDYNAPYPVSTKVFRYLNSGCYIAPIDEYLALTDEYPINYADDDQRYFTNIYLRSGKIKLDCDCKLFQSYAFTDQNDLTILPNKIINNHSQSEPAVIHFNGKCFDTKVYSMLNFNTLAEAQQSWKNDEETQKQLNDGFIEKVNAVDKLNDHRTFVEQNIFGFGERSFHWLWHLVVQELPKNFTFLEIGVLKGQTLSLVKMLADMQGKKVKRYGITPLSTEGGVWESDYAKDIEFIHDQFELEKDYKILQGLSEDPAIIEQAKKLKLDVLYIDGGHEERHITNDIEQYSPQVKIGGFMVIDDCCNSFRMPFGYFQGIDVVTRVVDAKLPPVTQSEEWEFVFSVVHNRVYRRMK
jgi:hypothetical protein